jgi:hypothetical protein
LVKGRNVVGGEATEPESSLLLEQEVKSIKASSELKISLVFIKLVLV